MQRREVIEHAGADRDEIARRGWARLPSMGEDAFLAFARGLGDVVNDTPVRLASGRRTYLTSPGAIPLHTDHSMADMITWRCESQDERDGASVLVDSREVVAALLPEVRRVLTCTILPAMVRLGDEPLPTPVLSDAGERPAIFYAPWLTPMESSAEQVEALRELGRAVDRGTPIAQRLRPGEVLVVDNHRVLHGRGPLLADSPRRLRRLWLRLPGR